MKATQAFVILALKRPKSDEIRGLRIDPYSVGHTVGRHSHRLTRVI